jgi:N-acetylmuramoyl-L-alanine amidase
MFYYLGLMFKEFCDIQNPLGKPKLRGLFKILNFFYILILFVYSPEVRANIEKDRWIFHIDNKQYSFQAFPSQKGLPRVSLNEIVKKLNLKLIYDTENFRITLINPKINYFIQFYTFDTHIVGKNFESYLSKSPEFFNVELHLPIDFGDRGLRPLLTGKPPPFFEVPKTPAGVDLTTDIVIDPGHGGNDWGTHILEKQKSLAEKDITLKFSKMLSEKLKELKVSNYLTRQEDSFLTLPERTAIANKLKAKFFLSIHVNSSTSPQLKGLEFFVLSLQEEDSEARSAIEKEQQRIPENLPEGFEKALADLKSEAQLEKSLKWVKRLNQALASQKSFSKNRVRMGPFYVLYGAEMPSVLLELGYLTNVEDRKRLTQDETLLKLANDLAVSLASTLKQGIP